MTSSTRRPSTRGPDWRRWRDLLQEVRELGWRGTRFRIGWELRQRTGLSLRPHTEPPAAGGLVLPRDWIERLPITDPSIVAAAMRDRVAPDQIAHLASTAQAATEGKILCFGRWMADFGSPIDWHLNPVTGQRWRSDLAWPAAMRDEQRVGDIKMTWELGRFPHAYHIARAAAFRPGLAASLATALATQLDAFEAANPYGRGIHWASGQEVAFRMLAWLFAEAALLARSEHRDATATRVATSLVRGATHVARHIDYARYAVYNNHLLSEALALYGVGSVLPEAPDAARWRAYGRQLLCEGASRQFDHEGGYIQLSHNYHRLALQTLLWARMFAVVAGDPVPPVWTGAMERSLDFLTAQQNPADGRLPNFGANDGGLPSIWSTCDFSDFRPTLQAVSVVTRGERLYDGGPWDEPSVWIAGADALQLPLRKPARSSVSFPHAGFHVLRGTEPTSFAVLRCGSIHERFSQIDMLHLDVWWRGENVLVDGGSFQYNAADEWHNYFFRTGSHNTVQVDGLDQMLHFRRFKYLYWTKARLLDKDLSRGHAVVSGEHDGFHRHPGRCTHRRSVLFVEPETWVVVDRIAGTGRHRTRLHWLAAPGPYEYDGADGRLVLGTPRGPFSVAVYDAEARPLTGDVVVGGEHPPRGWLARYYGEKIASPSLVVEQEDAVPTTYVSVLGGGRPMLEHTTSGFSVRTGTGGFRFRISQGLVEWSS